MSTDLEAVRSRFREGRCQYVVLPQLLPEERAAPIRDHVDEAGFEAFYEPDRGRYEINRSLEVPELFEELRELVAAIVGRPVRMGPAHWLRLRHRDYALLKNDATRRVVEGNHVEVTFDFSARRTGQAETVYTDGTQSWVVPQEPFSVAVVEREPWLYRYDRYLDHRVADAVVYRMRLALL